MLKITIIILSVSLLNACAISSNKDDPWENWNRGVYKFNKAVDKVAKPIAKGYKFVTPDVVESGISNIFDNLGDIPNMLNNLFQGNFLDSLSDLGRFAINSTVGLAGIWDPASKMGLEKHDEDFGQTLGAWGVAPGPYVMLPFLGPSTFRDTIAIPADSEMDLINQIDHIRTRNQIKFLQLVERRADLLTFEQQLKDAIDEYAFIRDVYLQNRQFKVLNGEIPFDEEDEDEED